MPSATVGDLLREWRAVRRHSQLELASHAGSTPRYISFIETGRARPSREMVVRLAEALDVPLRERNDLLLAAGYAPLYRAEPLSNGNLAKVDRALDAMLDRHDPLPALVLDRRWDIVRMNSGAERLFRAVGAPDPLPSPANVLRAFIEDTPLRAAVVNTTEVAAALVDRARREAVSGVLDPATAALVAELSGLAAGSAARMPATPASPVLDVQFRIAERDLRFFSVVSTIGTAIDVTAQELRVESFFPSDDETATAWADI